MVYRVIADKSKFGGYLQLLKADVQKDNIFLQMPARDVPLDYMAYELNTCFLSPHKYYHNSFKGNCKAGK